MTTEQTMPELMTEEQAAALLQVSESWLRKARYRGEAPDHVVLGSRMVRYDRETVLQWAREQRPKTND